MEKMPKIALLRWDADQISDVLMKLETLPGNSTNPESYPFDVALVHVKGANMDTVEVNPCQELLDEYIRVCKELAAQGVKAITTSCGFNAYYQEALAAAVPEVVFTSSLRCSPVYPKWISMVSDSSAVMISSFPLISAVISAPCATISATS